MNFARNIKLFEEWLAEDAAYGLPLGNYDVKWFDDYEEAKKVMCANEDWKKMDPSTFKKIFVGEGCYFKGSKFCFLMKKNKDGKEHVIAAANVGKRNDSCGNNGTRRPNIPFVYELAAMQVPTGNKDKYGHDEMASVYKGSGVAVMKEVVKKVGEHMWFRVLDNNADEFWKKFADRSGYKLKKIDIAGTKESGFFPVYEMNK